MKETKKDDIIQVSDKEKMAELQRLLVMIKLSEDAQKNSNN